MFTGMLAGIVLLVMSVLSASTAYAQSAGTAKNVAKQSSVSTAKPANGWLMTKEGIGPVKIGMRGRFAQMCQWALQPDCADYRRPCQPETRQRIAATESQRGHYPGHHHLLKTG